MFVPLSVGFLASVSLPTLAEVMGAVPVIVSLIIIEGLLSVDNALAIAAMARHLPERQQQLALKLGIVGAYFFRALCMGFASWIIENPWLKIGGAAYLIYLTCQHFTQEDAGAEIDTAGTAVNRGFLGTILSIEMMDLSLSVDNVVAAVAMSPKLWVVCTGVFIGILALRFVAGACLKVIDRYPILEETAFILIGYVGAILVFELLCDPLSGLQVFPGPVHISAGEKFCGIAVILLGSIFYSKSPACRRLFRPVFKGMYFPMRGVAYGVGAVLKVLFLPFALVLRGFRRVRGLLRQSSPAPEDATK